MHQIFLGTIIKIEISLTVQFITMKHPSRLAPMLKLRRKRKARQTRMNINVGVPYGLN
jgi:hypothetical protein